MEVLPQPPRACGQQGDGLGIKLILKYPMESWKGIFRISTLHQEGRSVKFATVSHELRKGKEETLQPCMCHPAPLPAHSSPCIQDKCELS
ncbi:hypothetical protein AV530_005242 [Patagioenas fasciata monilis]|uniref:Uncharacterized protein n=1 Tax=Patagioenas fasciata monilis TaxID=372326 RepID=A0A1V4JKU8_PATFA|nr:hypothetical protein AV530_005242 [Patagioenas fasciata monilis]